jgi:hypothetical protein
VLLGSSFFGDAAGSEALVLAVPPEDAGLDSEDELE